MAQDVHFAQFNSAPMLTNPSFTGNFDSQYRLGLNARSQWRQLANYQTLSFYGDVNLLQEALDGDWVSVGLVAFMDKAGIANLSATKIWLSTAFHKSVNEFAHVSFGVNGGYVRRGIDESQLYFNSQWNEVEFDAGLPSGETLQNNSIAYFVLNAGLNLNINFSPKSSFYAGASIYNLNRPTETFYDRLGAEEVNQLGLKPVLNVGGAFLKGTLSIEPAAYFTVEKKATELLVGANVAVISRSYNKRGTKLYFGTWYRLSDAIIPMVGIEYNNFKAMLSYDITISPLRSAVGSKGGPEISIIHVGGLSLSGSGKLSCPRF